MFQHDVMEHLEDHGLDTVSYVPDPSNPKEVVSVITDHGRFNLEEGSELANDIMITYFDDFDLNNVKDAKKLIYNSVDEDLKKQLNENCPKDTSFVAY